jgi:capsular polysaccharide biosynthesis protein
VDFPAILLALAKEAGIVRPQAWGDGVAETLRSIRVRLAPRHNTAFTAAGAAWVDKQAVVGSIPKTHRRLSEWFCADDPADWFAPGGNRVTTPELRLVRLSGGFVAQVGASPVVVAGDRRTIVPHLSSRYAPLLHYVPVDMAAMLDAAREVAGAAFLLGDDIWPPNYSHWLLDTLPRLSVLADAGARDATLVTGPLAAAFQRETLRLCGWEPAKIVELAPGQALRAERLLATTDQPQPPHPMFKGAPLAARYLRRHFVPPGTKATGRRLYISRDDAPGRRVPNEPELMAALAARGFERVLLGATTVPAQAAMLAAADWIVAPHGAGLSNLVFARPETTVLELFPRSYGTPAYYVIAAAGGLRYACHIGTEALVTGRDERQHDDFSVDVGLLLSRYRDFLPV